MAPAPAIHLSDKTQNIIENLACRLAQHAGGRITPSHILPYLPVSLAIIKVALDQMADGVSVVEDGSGNIMEYEFAAQRNKQPGPSVLTGQNCTACDTSLADDEDAVLCEHCSQILATELAALAEKTGWPARAVYEHEFLFHAAQQGHTVPATTIAATSRFTLRSTTKKLGLLSAANHIQQDLDRSTGAIRYRFPPVAYPRSRYDANMATIMTYPASVMEETEVKLVKILVAEGLLFFAGLLAGFLFKIPFPLLIVIIAVAGPIMAAAIWRHRDDIKE